LLIGGIVTPEELKQRTKDFALRIIELVRAMPSSLDGRAISSQIIRSGTSVAANYRSACRARSRPEFVAKLGIVIEEADETALWLELIIESGILAQKQVSPLLQEAREIVAIMTASVKSAGTQSSNKSAIRN
jgi:four helix bundle protein